MIFFFEITPIIIIMALIIIYSITLGIASAWATIKTIFWVLFGILAIVMLIVQIRCKKGKETIKGIILYSVAFAIMAYLHLRCFRGLDRLISEGETIFFTLELIFEFLFYFFIDMVILLIVGKIAGDDD